MPVCGAPLARARSRFSAATRSTIVSPAFARPAAKVRRRGENGHHPPVRSFRDEVSREPGPGIEAWTFAWLRAGSAPGGDFTGPIRWSQRSVGLLHIAADHLRREYEAARTETIPNAREICGRWEVLLSLRSCAQSGTACAR
jgi:hypothetical protein